MKQKFKSFCHKTNKYIDKHSPEILLGTAIAGFITTVVMVAKEAPIAKEKLDNLHRELGESEEPMNKPQIIFEEVKTVAPVYAPAVITGATSIACMLGSYNISAKRIAAWTTAAEIAQTNFRELKTKVAEEVGEKAVEKISHDIVQDHLDKAEKPKEESKGADALMTGKSLYCIDYNRRYFYATRDEVWAAVKTITDRFKCEDWQPLNDFLWELGLRDLSTDGDIVGFNSSDGIDIIFDSGLASDGQPCAVIRFEEDPMPCKY